MSRYIYMLAVMVLMTASETPVAAGTITWNLTTGGNWDTSTPNWTGTSTTFTDGGVDDVIFNKTNGGTITNSPNMSPRSTTVSATSGKYTFKGNPLDSGSLTKSGSGVLELIVKPAEFTPANFSSITVNGGLLKVLASGFAGASFAMGTGDFTVESGATFWSDRGVMTGTLVLNGGLWWESNGFGGSWTGPVYLGADSFFGRAAVCNKQAINGVVSGPGGFEKLGAPVLTLNSNNTYTGTTTISAGTVELGASGSINSTANISIAAGATFDVSLKASPYVFSITNTLSAAGTATAATLKGASGGTVSLGSQAVTLTYDGSNPALTVSQGTLELNGNQFTVNKAAPLAHGAYTVVTQTTGSISSSGTYPKVTGTAIGAGDQGTISVSGSDLLLTVELMPQAGTAFYFE